MDLTGIENEAEFFPAGTLSDVLETELSDIVGRWKDLPRAEHPVERLFKQAETVTTLLNQFRNTQDKQRRFELHRQLGQVALTALGYEIAPKFEASDLENSEYLPLLGELHDGEGQPALWLLEAAPSAMGEDASDPLGQTFDRQQFEPTGSESYWDVAAQDLAIEELVADGIFKKTDAPRYVLVVGSTQLVLLDARKWPARSVLRFDLQDIFSRQDKETFQVMACLVSREARVPNEGLPLSDRLEEEAQRNANAVTTSLKKTVRDAIEILGQEVLDVSSGSLKKIDQEELTRECLRYMYRLLFLFYAESNPRLGILRLDDPLYASGYSVEALRDLESKRLRTAKERQGTFIWESLQKTLTLLFRGESQALRLPQIKVKLLDPDSTPILNSLKLRNQAIQKIIWLLSLRKTPKSTGRISYSKLGIGQLGAVYETLISFTGTIATEDLIEIKGDSKNRAARASDKTVTTLDGEDDYELATSRKDKPDTLAPSYFVPRKRIAEFNPDAVVFDGTRARIYKKGSFIYRLAGRDREKSASYYTPEPLARLLVKHVLMERCRDLSADEILELKVLEPAMGSAAFLVETTNQLADLYLERKQKELGEVIPQDQIVLEKQKVRSFIADRNCFGVDLNPIAVELGAISLWLNGLHNSQFSPWFGDQLHAGNSLVGARRAAYPASMLMAKGKDGYLKQPPEEFGWKTPLKPGFVWQWLLPAEDMAAFDKDKSIIPFAGAAQEHIKDWRRGGFFAPLTQAEINVLQQMTETANQLFEQVADDLAATRANANDRIEIWPGRLMEGTEACDFRAKEKLKAHLVGDDHVANTLPYKRLKTAMDAWCALWLWPLDKAEHLPSRPLFLQSMARILQGGFSADGSFSSQLEAEAIQTTDDLFSRADQEAEREDLLVAEPARLFNETNVEALVESFEWLKVAMSVADKERFVHFDLIFADILCKRGGFDVIVGNPPWAKPNWIEGNIISDLDPIYSELSASAAKKALPVALEKTDGHQHFLSEYTSTRGAMEVTSSSVMNPYIGGGSNNLYRCFMDVAWRLTAPEGYSALIHQDGHLGDPKAAGLRRNWYGRVVKHFEFSNKMTNKMFAEVHHELKFSLNVYRGTPAPVAFDQITNAFLASQVDDSYADVHGLGEMPSIKNAEGNWDTRGHRGRVIPIDSTALKIINALSESDGVPLEETQFIQPFSRSTLEVFEQLAKAPKMGESAEGEGGFEWQMACHWHETNSQKDGTIQRETAFRTADEMVIQGPHFHVANPFYKTPRAKSVNNSDYDVIDLTQVPADYLPRTNYRPAVDKVEYRRRMTKCRWDSSISHGDFYRLAMRNMIALNGERSLISAIIPPKVSHVNTVESVAFSKVKPLLTLGCFSQSVVNDFAVKAAGMTHLFTTDVERFQWTALPNRALTLQLRLACLQNSYADLWRQSGDFIQPFEFSRQHPALEKAVTAALPPEWTPEVALKTEFARRQALVEIDVLVARALGITLDQLIDIYRVYFPVLQENETGTWYDQNGRIVWTCSKGLPGVGYLNEKGKSPGRKDWEKLLEDEPTTLTCTAVDDTLPTVQRTVERHFVGPFFTCDRIEDYQVAWAFFDQLEAEGKLH